MEHEKETKKKLLQCASREFSEKGYMKASLRNICKDAGVTTGALYFFFKDKEDLFGSLLDEPVEGLEKIIRGHFTEELAASEGLAASENPEDQRFTVQSFMDAEGLSSDVEISRQVIRYLFKHRKPFELLLTKSQGSKYENYVDYMIEMIESHYRSLYSVMKGYTNPKQLTKSDLFIVHWMSTDQIEVFRHIFTHCRNVKEAERNLDQMIAYLLGGWYSVIGLRKE